MRERLENFLVSAEIRESNKDELHTLLRTLTIILAVGAIAVDVMTIARGNINATIIMSIFIVLIGLSFLFLQRGQPLAAQILLPLTTLVNLLTIISIGGGTHDANVIALTITIIIAGLTLGANGQVFFGILTWLGLMVIGMGEITGLITNAFSKATDSFDLATTTVTFFVIIALQRFFTTRLLTSLQKAKASEQNQVQINQSLRELQESLENRVSQRTLELEQRSKELSDRTVQLELANIHTQRRAAQLLAIADVTKAIGAVRNLNDLLQQIVTSVSERFGYYHVGIFLNDAANRQAILAAANSIGGQKMLERGHRLNVGAQGIVGFVTASGEARIALDVGEDAVFFNNPDLPETHSEMAVPLQQKNSIIGALDVQSTKTNAFAQEDIEVLSTLANQISIAIENARLFESNQKTISEVETIYQQYLQERWNQAGKKQQVVGFQYSVAGATPLKTHIQSDEALKALQQGAVTANTGEAAILAVPIKIREKPIGVINIRMPGKRAWKEDEVILAQAIADRVAISAENARLFEESQERAAKEQIISEITSKIGASINMNNIMQTAVEELGRVLTDSEVSLQLKK